MTESKPCPFCGSDEVAQESPIEGWGRMVCEACGATGPEIRTRMENKPENEPKWRDAAIEAWNERAE